MKSITTTTVMRSDVPPKANGMESCEIMISGNRQIAVM